MLILNIILFIICLSVLVVVHELGHLGAAKAFNVYCFEFSVGFGPAFFRKKRKNGETYVAFRAIPFGGYVSMYGESTDENSELPDGIESISKERSLANIKKWKKAIVLAAGVVLNAVLALLIFFVANGPWFEQQVLYMRRVAVEENSIAETAGITDQTSILVYGVDDNGVAVDEIAKEAYTSKAKYMILSLDSIANYNTGETKQVAALLSTSDITFKSRDYDEFLHYFTLDLEGNVNYAEEVKAEDNYLDHITLNLVTVKLDENDQRVETSHTLQVETYEKDGKEYFANTGLSTYLYKYRNTIGQTFKYTFEEFGESSVLIFKALGGLFIGQGWENVGGAIAIFNQSSTMLSEFGVVQFLRLWAIISVNLAIFNLIPFPGLDGWQLLVLAIEGISRKKVPEKVQGIVSFVGMIILFAFMAFILIKDVIGLF